MLRRAVTGHRHFGPPVDSNATIVMSKKQAWWKARQKGGVKFVRDILRSQGTMCLRCLSRPRERGSRCIYCWQEREDGNKGRKR